MVDRLYWQNIVAFKCEGNTLAKEKFCKFCCCYVDIASETWHSSWKIKDWIYNYVYMCVCNKVSEFCLWIN